MSRQLKFRAWDTTLFKMFEPRTLRDIAKEAPNYGVNWYQFKIMQYTGLKDKNGVEIYQGDVLKLVFGNGGDPLIVDDLLYFGWFDREFCNIESSEIIGNIYENPELLDNQQNSE